MQPSVVSIEIFESDAEAFARQENCRVAQRRGRELFWDQKKAPFLDVFGKLQLNTTFMSAQCMMYCGQFVRHCLSGSEREI